MLVGPLRRLYMSGPAGSAGATLAAALGDVTDGMKAVLTAPNLGAARAGLGLAIGSSVQAWNATLDGLAALTTTAFGRSLLTQADAPTALSTLGAAASGRQVIAGTGLTGGGDLSQDRTFALAGIATGSLLANTAAGPGASVPVATTVTALLDANFGSTRGQIIVRGASGWAALALGASGYTLQSNGSDLVYAASTPGTGALRYDTGQSLSGGQQDQVRVNVSGAVAAAPSASASLVAADFDRPLNPTGAITLTMPNGGAGWRSGPIKNANLLSGLITLAVTSGATLDGVANGTTLLRPYQRARIVQTGASAYVTDWIDQTPIIRAPIASSVTSVALPMPVGYSAFEIVISGVTVDTSGTSLGLRFTSDGGATYKAGASDYYVIITSSISGVATPSPPPAGALSYAEIAANVLTTGYMPVSAKGTIYPGSATFGPAAIIDSAHTNATPASVVRQTSGRYTTAALLANGLQLIATSGNLTGGTITLRAVP